MRKTALLIATVLLLTALTACSGNNGTGSTSAADTEQQDTTATADVSAEAADNKTEDQNASQASTGEGGIDVDKGLMNVEITIPAEAAETYGFHFESQEEADAYAKEQGFKSVTLGDDGSITIVMSKAQHKKVMEELNKTLDEAVQEMVGSEDYPNITAIEHNDDYTNFKVTTTSEELSFNESFSGVAFFMFGAMYNSFNGTSVDNIHVDFINEASGEVIDTFDSKNLDDAGGSDNADAADSADDTDYAAQLEKEELYPVYLFAADASILDNFMDGLMVDTCRVSDSYSSIIEAAFDNNGYPRYWNGYLLTLRPTMTQFTYHQIRYISMFFLLTPAAISKPLCGVCAIPFLMLSLFIISL